MYYLGILWLYSLPSAKYYCQNNKFTIFTIQEKMFDNLLNNYFVFTVNTIGVTLTKLLLSYVLTSNINIVVNYCGVLSCIHTVYR